MPPWQPTLAGLLRPAPDTGLPGLQVIVATGFIAKTPGGQVTTLKRNGSDYSATIVGSLVRGARITIWTDVDGVFSADPRKVPPLLAGLQRVLSCQQGHRCASPLGVRLLLSAAGLLALTWPQSVPSSA